MKVFETLLFAMDQGSISIYLDEVNMHLKFRLRDDHRLNSLLFFEEQLLIVAHIKHKGSHSDAKRDAFKKLRSLSEIQG